MPADDEPKPALSPERVILRRGRRRRRLGYLAIAIATAIIATELFTRFYLGLTDPPLMMADPELEYVNQPNQTCRMFRHLIHYNAYSMRSDDFPQHKTSPDELRVMFIGDSIINGGTQTDQSELATSILQRELTGQLKRPVVVGNISTGGWGPPNELAYVKRFGLFDADVVVIVISSHDYNDVPTFDGLVGISKEMPTSKPLSGAAQLWSRYVWPRIQDRWAKSVATHTADGTPTALAPVKPEDVAACTEALKQMIRFAHERGARVIVAQYLEPHEVNAAHPDPDPGHDVLLAAATQASADQIVQLGPAFAAALNNGASVFRDVTHPTAAGQRVMADVLRPALLQAIQTARAAPTTGPEK